MPKTESRRLTPLEALVMDAVWQLGEATVRQVKDHLDPDRPMAYNTVLTVMRILRDKGFLKTRRHGRMDVYRPIVSRDQAARSSVGELLDRFFAGSATALVSQLLESERIGAEQMRQIRRQVDSKLREESRTGGRS
jgi:BlaI family penicillinase repressor